ncbi:ATP-dependent helicase brm [Armadillidium vulgare]|nr:ATP-dependent helicase brm [Armadillidium vulgare]
MGVIFDGLWNGTSTRGRVLSVPFMKLPSRRELPDYYEIIKRPMDIKKILGKIDEGKYEDINDLEKDFVLMCHNAQEYNEEASVIYEDSIVMQSVFCTARERIEQEADNANDDVYRFILNVVTEFYEFILFSTNLNSEVDMIQKYEFLTQENFYSFT